jgi:hypothetical protein
VTWLGKCRTVIGEALEAMLRPQLIIDNSFHRSAVVNFMRAITASTLTEDVPAEMQAMIDLLNDTPANTPSCPPTTPQNAVGFA